MTTQEIANKLVAFCRNGEWDKAQDALYADNAISIEPYATPAFEKETKGLAAIRGKGAKFEAMVEATHSITISEPLIAGNSIAFTLEMDITMKGRGRETMKEMCVYEVKDGKIVAEYFFM